MRYASYSIACYTESSISAPQLYEFQRRLVDDIAAEHLAGHDSILAVLPTGGGKTFVFCDITRSAVAAGGVVFICVHRRELVEQTSRSLTRLSVPHSFICAGRPYDPRARAFVVSIPTIIRRLHTRLPRPTLLILDEAHHAAASTWSSLVDALSVPAVRGFTATPVRTDGQGLRSVFSSMVLGPPPQTLVDNGTLVPIVTYAREFDLSGMRTSRSTGDYTPQSVAAQLENTDVVGSVIGEYRRIADREPAIAFCATVAHAAQTAERFRDAGYSAAHVHGGTPVEERDRLIRDLASRHLHVLTSCDIISEGTDIPAATVAMMLRPTQSLALNDQQVGRVARSEPGKRRGVLLDFVGNVFRHGYPHGERVWTLDGVDEPAQRRRELAVPPPKTCLGCYRDVAPPVPDRCPHCDALFAQPRKIRERAGDLVEHDENKRRLVLEEKARIRKEEERAAGSYEEFLALGYARGYKYPEAWARKRAQLRSR